MKFFLYSSKMSRCSSFRTNTTADEDPYLKNDGIIYSQARLITLPSSVLIRSLFGLCSVFVRSLFGLSRIKTTLTLILFTFNHEFVMGKITGGQLSGAVGKMVFYSYNDTEYVRMAPGKRSKKSWSERQQLNWQRFSALTAFWSQFRYSQVVRSGRLRQTGEQLTQRF
jgi:hypothetical protein